MQCVPYPFQTPIAINQSPSLREKAILLVKLMQHVEKRFPEDNDLNAQFLELVNYIYRCVGWDAARVDAGPQIFLNFLELDNFI